MSTPREVTIASPPRPLLECKSVSCPPGSTLVIRSPMVLSGKAIANLRRSFGKFFPDNKVVVLKEGLDIEVLDTREPSRDPLMEIGSLSGSGRSSEQYTRWM